LITAYIDGGARGNPGPAGYGVYIQGADGAVLGELYGGLGIATNNVAEYNGLLAALQWAKEHGHTTVHVKADSLLIVEQMRGGSKSSIRDCSRCTRKPRFSRIRSAASRTSTCVAS